MPCERHRRHFIPTASHSGETAAGKQRLYVVSVNKGLSEMDHIDGVVNGPDFAGIRIVDVVADGRVEILAGLPQVPMDTRAPLPDALAHHFEVYRWSVSTQEFAVDGVWTAPGVGPLNP